MPYYVFAVASQEPPCRVADAPSYREAKAVLGALREAAAKADARPPGAYLRMIFAADERAALELLARPREPDPALDAEDD